MSKDKKKKERSDKYEEKVSIKGTFDDVLRVSANESEKNNNMEQIVSQLQQAINNLQGINGGLMTRIADRPNPELPENDADAMIEPLMQSISNEVNRLIQIKSNLENLK